MASIFLNLILDVWESNAEMKDLLLQQSLESPDFKGSNKKLNKSMKPEKNVKRNTNWDMRLTFG
jgi:hypothetical protein